MLWDGFAFRVAPLCFKCCLSSHFFLTVFNVCVFTKPQERIPGRISERTSKKKLRKTPRKKSRKNVRKKSRKKSQKNSERILNHFPKDRPKSFRKTALTSFRKRLSGNSFPKDFSKAGQLVLFCFSFLSAAFCVLFPPFLAGYCLRCFLRVGSIVVLLLDQVFFTILTLPGYTGSPPPHMRERDRCKLTNFQTK